MKSLPKGVMMGAVALMLAWALPVAAQESGQVTFTKDVLPILQENCQTCHRPFGAGLSGMVAPMSLMTYEEVRPWAKAIARVVEVKQMPPWHMSEQFNGVFANERTLTQKEIKTIQAWANTGARRGNPEDAPKPVEFPDTGWNIGEPDLVVDFPEPFWVADEVEDLYQNINTVLSEEQLPKDRWIHAAEFKMGSEVVHHIIGHATLSSDEGERTTRGMIGGNAPGSDPEVFPDGYGILLKKGSVITFAMHYHKEPGPGTGVWDNSQLGIKFHPEDQEVKHPVEISNISYGSFEIPPLHNRWKVGASRTFMEDTVLIGMLPHMHLRGSAAKYTAFYPDGSTELLLDVPASKWSSGSTTPRPRPPRAGSTRMKQCASAAPPRMRWTSRGSPSHPRRKRPT
jgi:mono/diheme cytochrome c family protein